MIESELPNIRIFLAEVTMEIGPKKYFLSILLWKISLGLIKLKI